MSKCLQSQRDYNNDMKTCHRSNEQSPSTRCWELIWKKVLKIHTDPCTARQYCNKNQPGCTRLTAGFAELNWQPQTSKGQLQFSAGLVGCCLILLGGLPSWVRYSQKPTAICMWTLDWNAGFVTFGNSKRSDTDTNKQLWFLLLCTHHTQQFFCWCLEELEQNKTYMHY